MIANSLSKTHFSSYIDVMATIGLYDSGIGGLTTLKILLEKFKGNDFFYLADNASHPFGTKRAKDLEEIVSSAVATLKNNCDYPVLACNTASSIYKDNDAIKLLPPLPPKNADLNKWLLMATDLTREIASKSFRNVAETSDLASMIEVQASINSKHGNLNMRALLPYLANSVFKFKGVKNVVLGCSHYPLCKKEISKLLGDVRFFDGNESVVNSLEKYVSPLKNESKITFRFTGGNEEKKYRKILSILLAEQN